MPETDEQVEQAHQAARPAVIRNLVDGMTADRRAERKAAERAALVEAHLLSEVLR